MPLNWTPKIFYWSCGLFKTVCVETVLAGTQCDATNLRSCFCTNEILQAKVSICVLAECTYQEQVGNAPFQSPSSRKSTGWMLICIVASNLQASTCEGVPQPSRSNEIIHTITILSAFTFPILCLRCISRWSITRRLWWDDWMAVLAGVRSPLQQRWMYLTDTNELYADCDSYLGYL